MKLILFTFLFTTFSAGAYQCTDFQNDPLKVETLKFIATEAYGYESGEEFCATDTHLDLELYFVPNLFLYQEEEDDHYKFMVHYNYRSCTFIYNQTQKFLSKKSCYSTW
ncbi:hypothetical protein A9Q84_16430 [Halobacteriovorax marinus]|uniref:Lipoprotein n=1 Tax=Halobacteriovorax marinus TaxID=97084 RepID=A0A1Y5F9S4_9BACT|nr:hypothetical protein A9Q84_16430 [Halobacteriovorax marinus]